MLDALEQFKYTTSSTCTNRLLLAGLKESEDSGTTDGFYTTSVSPAACQVHHCLHKTSQQLIRAKTLLDKVMQHCCWVVGEMVLM